jgi:hypothetical protein
LSPKLKVYRDLMYNYHINGLDNLVKSKSSAQQTIEDSVLTLERIFNKTVGNYLVRLFFDAKADEIVSIYSEPTKTRRKQRLIQSLRKISTNNNSKWRKLD